MTDDRHATLTQLVQQMTEATVSVVLIGNVLYQDPSQVNALRDEVIGEINTAMAKMWALSAYLQHSSQTYQDAEEHRMSEDKDERQQVDQQDLIAKLKQLQYAQTILKRADAEMDEDIARLLARRHDAYEQFERELGKVVRMAEGRGGAAGDARESDAAGEGESAGAKE